MSRSVYQISAPHFTAGIEMENGFVVRAAPIVRYMLGWQMLQVQQYVARKRWRLAALRV